MKQLPFLTAMALVLSLGCGKPKDMPGPETPGGSETNEPAGNKSSADKVADSLQDISSAIRNVQTVTENVRNMKGLQLVPDRVTWEYKIVEPSGEISLDTRLNELGAIGWELAATTRAGNFIFKRPKAAE